MNRLPFSERHGHRPLRVDLQKKSMDDGLKNRLWNALSINYWKLADSANESVRDLLANLLARIWDGFYKLPLDNKPRSLPGALEHVRWYFERFEWDRVYDFLEFVSENFPIEAWNQDFNKGCNKVLKQEFSAYRFIDGLITPMTSDEEIEAIETALADTDGLKPVQHHLKDALGKLSDRHSPDYRNSIKEAISAVESLCCRIAGEKTDLGRALEKLEASGVDIHGALGSAFQKMYGYTSNEDGIRHAMMDVPDLDFEDAKFMLVACSGFVSYLIEKSQKAGIKL